MEELKRKRAEAEKEIERLQVELNIKKNDLRAIELELIRLQYGIGLGSIVIYTGRDKKKAGKRVKVTKISPSFHKPWVEGVPELKAGVFGVRVVYLFGEWEPELQGADHGTAEV